MPKAKSTVFGKGCTPNPNDRATKGLFEHGKEVGTFRFFDDTKAGTVVATREFKPDGSAYTIFFKDGKFKVSEGKEVNRLYEGKWIYYHENLPDIMTVENYKAGKLHGKRTVYYRGSGVAGEENVAEEANYANGKKEGPYKSYTMKGTLLEDSNFKNGQLDGPATYWDPLGKVVAKGVFKDGKKVGKWEYFKDGKPVKKDNDEVIKKRKKPSKPRKDPNQ
ncbi:toxin-antitoxin system YwqK family antitoxin [Flavobacterium sp.]|uniref:toxin-antitoxin system YwqK family antitoxin n=1 Tax=Flavobacterium sp. TaxID=239 RepID=UPI0039E4F621